MSCMGSLGIVPIQTQTGVDPLGGRNRQTPVDRMVSLEKLSSIRGLCRPSTNCVLAALSRSERKTDVSLPGAPHGFALEGYRERKAPMNRSTYGERNYAFGQAMLTLRTGIGLTQAGLADLLHVSRRAVAEWEAGSNYPTVGHLKHLIALGVRQQAFAAGREVQEIRALWKAARQKVNLDEPWLAALLGKQTTPLAPLP